MSRAHVVRKQNHRHCHHIKLSLMFERKEGAKGTKNKVWSRTRPVHDAVSSRRVFLLTRSSKRNSSKESITSVQSSTMPALEADEQMKEERLKAALWYAMGQTIDSVALAQNLNATPHFIGGLSEFVWAQIENVAQDLEAFAKHSDRTTINTKDVLLLGRRNEGLAEVLQHQATVISGRNATTNSR